MNKTKEALIRNINKSILPKYRTLLIDLIKPAIRLYPTNTNNSFSKIGGFPSLPKSIVWPREIKENTPYSFVLQLKLEEINAVIQEDALPKKGMLYFFLNLNTWDDGKVIFYDGEENLEKPTLPKELLNRNKKASFWERLTGNLPNYYHVFEPFKIKFEKEFQIPTWSSIQVELFKSKNNIKSIESIIEEESYFEDIIDESTPDHHLLGYYWAWQEASYEMFCLSDDLLKETSNEKVLLKASEWILLFQLDFDSKLDMHWADGGKVLFFIHKEDLKERNFENVVVTLDTC
jgi:uncharacterized protein YwqG